MIEQWSHAHLKTIKKQPRFFFKQISKGKQCILSYHDKSNSLSSLWIDSSLSDALSESETMGSKL